MLQPDSSLAGQVALVTGASRGIGHDLVLALAGAGAIVAAAVIYLASPAGGMVTGTVLVVDGGWTAQ